MLINLIEEKNEMTENLPAVKTVFSMQALTKNIETVLAKADSFAVTETTYSNDELDLIRPIANSIAPKPSPIEPAVLRQALMGLGHMPAQDGGDGGGKIKFAVYKNRLSEFPAEAIFRACRSWLDTGTFFPSIADLRKQAKDYITPEQRVINTARLILRCGKRPSDPLPPPDDAERRAFNGQMRRIGGLARMFPGETDAREIQPGEDEPEFDEAEFALAEVLRRD
jgi:hypothetical protein